MMMLVLPVALTAFTSDCMLAAWYGTPGQVPPILRQAQAAAESWLLSGYGSLNKSKITELLDLNAFATDVQNAGA